MNRIDRIFQELRSSGRKALMPFLTAGDPDLATTGRLLQSIEQAGAHVCELGVAFSDPIADGPVIQASMAHALDGGIRPQHVLDMVAGLRSKLSIGIVAMVSYSIVHRLGDKHFIADAKSAGLDGFIFPDLPLDESDRARDMAAEHGLTCSMLISPTTPMDRAARIARASTGFVYLLARAGITGEQKSLAADLPEQIKRLAAVTDVPIAVGFGISQRSHIEQVVRYADAAIVGSAIMRRIAEHRDAGSDAIVGEVGRFVRDLAGGLGGNVR